jgi:hypothetical protein
MISAIFSKPCFSGTTLEKRTRSRVKPGSAPTPQEYWLTAGHETIATVGRFDGLDRDCLFGWNERYSSQ